jgi:hypothetical protein
LNEFTGRSDLISARLALLQTILTGNTISLKSLLLVSADRQTRVTVVRIKRTIETEIETGIVTVGEIIETKRSKAVVEEEQQQQKIQKLTKENLCQYLATERHLESTRRKRAVKVTSAGVVSQLEHQTAAQQFQHSSRRRHRRVGILEIAKINPATGPHLLHLLLIDNKMLVAAAVALAVVVGATVTIVRTNYSHLRRMENLLEMLAS